MVLKNAMTETMQNLMDVTTVWLNVLKIVKYVQLTLVMHAT